MISHACRMPITKQEKTLESYQEGISCLHCYGKVSEEQKQRFAQRQKQIQTGKSAWRIPYWRCRQQDTERRRAEKKRTSAGQRTEQANLKAVLYGGKCAAL